MEWLSKFIDRLFCWLPRIWLVHPDEEGVKITLGKYWKKAKPGWYIYLPLFQAVDKILIRTQVVDLRPQSLWTLDRDNLAISGSIRYRISDAAKAILEVQNFDETIVALSLGIIFDFTKNKTSEEISKNIEGLKQQILAGLRKEAQGWGLKIENVYLTDIGDVSNLRLLMNLPANYGSSDTHTNTGIY